MYFHIGQNLVILEIHPDNIYFYLEYPATQKATKNSIKIFVWNIASIKSAIRSKIKNDEVDDHFRYGQTSTSSSIIEWHVNKF